jgi:TldD protein
MLPMDLKQSLQLAVDRLNGVFENASALFTSVEGVRLQVSNREESFSSLDPKCGIVFRGMHQGRFFEVATSSLNPEDWQKCRYDLLQMADLPPSTPLVSTTPKKRVEKTFETKVNLPLEQVPLQEKFLLCRTLSSYATCRDSRVLNATTLLKEEFIEEIFVDSQKCLHQKLCRVDTIVLLVLRENENSIQIWDGESLASGFEGVGLSYARIDRIIEDGLLLLKAKRLNPGFYECIVSPAVSGMIAHEAFGHGAETDMMAKGRSRGWDYLGKRVGSPLVNMLDYARYSDSTTLFFFDHEGCEVTEGTQILKEGILLQGISDTYSASLLGLPKTPNGRRESYERKTYSRMTNTYFEPGGHSLPEMIATIENGVLLDYPTNGMEDPKQWGIQVETLMAREIKNGKLTGLVYSPIIITGYVPDLLQSISMVSKEFAISTLGMCGKGYKEWVKVHDGGPWLKLKARLG